MALIRAEIQSGEKSITVDIPQYIYDIYSLLRENGINEAPKDMRLADRQEDSVRVKLTSDSDMGNHIIRLFNENTTLAEVNTAANVVSNTHEVIRDDLEQNILYDQYDTAKEMIEDIQSLTENAATVKETFYFPLTGTMYDAEDGENYDVDNSTLVANEDEISAAIEQYIISDDYNMAYYYDEIGKEKLLFANWGLAYIGGTLYGKVDVGLTEAMTEQEKAELKEWISGQNSDGAGEGFEQKDIETDDGTLNVSFWHSGDDYFIYDQAEMDEYINQQSNMQMGVM